MHSAMLSLVLTFGGWFVAANPAPNPLMARIFFRAQREVVRVFAPCEQVKDDPITERCRFKLHGRQSETFFVFDDTKRVHAVLVGFPPVERLDDTEELVKALANDLSGQFGPPTVQKPGNGAVWSWNSEHGIATMKLMKADADAWVVTVSLKEAHLPGRFTE